MTQDDYEAIAALVRQELQAMLPEIVRVTLEMVRGADRASVVTLPETASEFDRALAAVVEALWRDQGRRPVTTGAVAMRCGYSLSHTRRLLQDAEALGVVRSVPRRGRRHSGRWLPLSAVA